jgi:hypothetical protein
VVLQVPFEQFPDAVRRTFDGLSVAYISSQGNSIMASASQAGAKSVVIATTGLALEEAREKLVEAEMEVFEGRWTAELFQEEPPSDPVGTIYIAGISYRTEQGPPGLWLDAYPSLPTQVQVLRSMYDELIETGEMAEVSFEEFVRLSDANVIVASPSDLRSYLSQRASQE